MSVHLRFRKTRSKGFSAYFDLYRKGKRCCEYTEIYLSQDYSQPLKTPTGQPLTDAKGNPCYPKILQQDKAKLELLEKIQLQRELQLKNEEYGFADSRIKKINLMDYLMEIYQEKKSENYFNLLKQLKKCFGETLRFGEIDEKTIRRFLHYLSHETSLGRNTQCTYFASLSSVFNEAVRDKIITHNPCRQIARQDRPKKEESKRTYLTLEELLLLANTPLPSAQQDYQVKEAFLFSCLTGLRISDLLNIGYSDIKEGVLQYRQKKSQQQFHYLPLSKEAEEILATLNLDPKGESVFWKLKRKISISYRLHLLDEWVKSSGIVKKVTWHVGRHTCATLLLTYGNDIYMVSKILGHSSVSITEGYAKIINTRKVEAVNTIPGILSR